MVVSFLQHFHSERIIFSANQLAWHHFYYHSFCCPEGMLPNCSSPHKKEVMKHRKIICISPKEARCLLGQAGIAKIGISSCRPERSFTVLVMSCVGHSPNTHLKNHIIQFILIILTNHMNQTQHYVYLPSGTDMVMQIFCGKQKLGASSLLKHGKKFKA